MGVLLGLILGTCAPQWGHTWIARGYDNIYALRSLQEGSSLLVYKTEHGGNENGPVFFSEKHELALVGEYKISGQHSCHITILNHQAIISDYTSGTLTVFNLDNSGIPTGQAEVVSFPVRDSSSPKINKERQSSSHIHSSWKSQDGKSLVVVDLGFDRIYRYPISDGKIVPNGKYDILQLPDGCGPRHCLFNGNFLYVATELSDEVLVYKWPEMELIQRCNTNPKNPGGGAHILISPDGKFIYVSSRLENDGISIFKVASDGRLTYSGYQNTGSHPRHFSISKDGKHIAVACRDSDIVEIYSRNENTGLLSRESEYNISKPVFADFYKE